MSHAPARRMIPIVFLVVLIVAGVIYLAGISGPENGPLAASGTVAAVEVEVAAEISGRVTEVYVEEGGTVEAGQPLFRLDETLLGAQRDRAAAALESARLAVGTADAAVASAAVQVDLATQAARLQAAPARESLWAQSVPWQFNLPTWYFSPAEDVAAAEYEETLAAQDLESAQARLESVLTSAGVADEEERVARAEASFEVAQSVLDRALAASSGQAVVDEAQARRDAAQDELTAANDAYDEALDDDTASDVEQARAVVAVAQARLDAAHARLASLRLGDESLQVRAARAAFAQAQAARDQAAGVLAQARAELTLSEVQLDRLTINAPISGVVVTRSVEPGEVVVAGGAVMTIGDLQHLSLTIYLPAARYGEISLGDRASVTVDSFPGQVFTAEVARIAEEAEFTPRNVQTEEGRRTTVFAVELTLDNPGGDLKPGMPADVEFGAP